MSITFEQLAEKTISADPTHITVTPGNAGDVNVQPVEAGSDNSKEAQNKTSSQSGKIKSDFGSKGDAKKLDPEPVEAGSDTTSEGAIKKAPKGSMKK